MDDRLKFLIQILKATPEDKGIDLNREKPEREIKIALLEKSFDDLLLVLKEGEEDKKNINEMIDRIIDQLENFRIQNTGKLEDILPRIYSRTDFVELPEVKETRIRD